MMGLEPSLWAMFASAFLASTLLPGGSEALFLYLLQQHDGAGWPLLLAVATVGNSLGGMSSWLIGWLIARRWSGGELRAEHRQAVARIERYGAVLLLLSWVPVIGDPLCVAAGWLRIHWLPSLLFITLGKGARYALLVTLAG